ncbi:MAG: phage tail sheath family protein [Symbiobacteriaceae bacterium]|nr:phage tail sheath family protein [Symbiobacteriaceae bacterium]
MIQDMVRPGSRIEFESVPEPAMTVGGRGVASLALPMNWGAEDELITITSTDLATGATRARIGYSASEPGSLLFRECLRYCYKLLVWRSDRGGKTASAELAPLSVTARYGGSRGNDLKIVVKETEIEDVYLVETYLDETLVDEQRVSNIEELVGNDWVKFSGQGSLEDVLTAGLPLSEGTSGAITPATYGAYHAALSLESWQTMGIIDEASNVPALVQAFIENQREVQRRKVQGVVYNSVAANYDGIIAVKQGYVLESGEEISKSAAIAMVAGMSAGAAINESNTNRLINGAVRIIGELSHDEIIKALQDGWFVISKRVNGAIKIEQDINTFREFRPKKGKEYRKNRVIRTLDEMHNTISLTWENFYEGHADNDRAGRNSFKADLISYFRSVEALRAIDNFASEDIIVARGTEIDAVIAEAYVQPVDSMEKLYMTVYTRVGGA